MPLDSEAAAEKVSLYLHHAITIGELNTWAQAAVKADDFGDDDDLKTEVKRLSGSLTWDDLGEIMRHLGYSVRVEVVQMTRGKHLSGRTRVMVNKPRLSRRVTKRLPKHEQ